MSEERAIDDEPREILLLMRDLGFRSTLSSAAGAAGIKTRAVRDPAALSAIEKGRHAAIIDLGSPGFGDPEVVSLLVSMVQPDRIVAIYPHVSVELAEMASSAGITQIMPRSRLSQRVHEILQQLSAS